MAKKVAKTSMGLNREQLIETATRYGRDLAKAKKASTKTLENFIKRQIVGKSVRLPEFSENDQKTIAAHVKEWGLGDGLKRLTYRANKLTGNRNEYNFLRLTIQENFALFVKHTPTAEQIDYLISQLPRMEETQVDSDLIKMTPYYTRLFSDYADQLAEDEAERQRIAEQQANEQFEEQTNGSTQSSSQSKPKKTKRKSRK